MQKNHIAIIFIGLIFTGLILSNLYFFKKNLDLNEQLEKIFELEAMLSELKADHQREISDLKNEYENEISRITNEYSQKFETVKKALNAFTYELEEFYKNKHILKEDYLENIRKIEQIRENLGSTPDSQ